MRLLLVALGLALVVLATAAVLFVALLWHRNFFWVAVPLATVALYLVAWFSEQPLGSPLSRALIASIGGGLAFEVFFLGAPFLALAYLGVGVAVAWTGSVLVRLLRERAHRAAPLPE